MTLAISEDHLALLDAVRRFTAARCDQKVVREAVDAETEALPPFWDDLIELGWLDLGADGYGLAEVAVVVEELGRAMAPGPMLPTVWAAACTGRPPEGPAAVALSLDAPVLGAALAESVVVPTGADAWGVVRSGGFTATPVESLDPTRRVATVEVHGEVEPLGGLTTERVRALGAVLLAAEAAGGAAWCVETASSYAKVREQFGKPIGRFQAVKHKCADMLVAVEQARGAAWDAARDGDLLAALVAGAIAPDAFVRVAKDCIQVLGGIGFTWEHDAHLYLRRATSIRQLLGGPSSWRRAAAKAALAGERRRLAVDLPPEAEAMRDEVRAFAESVAALPKEERRARLVDEGYFMPHWPEPWGRGASAVEQLVIEEELRRAKIRIPNLAVGAWAAPTIAAHGTLEQQERWVRPTLMGEIAWCQLFSEPGAGSDLAALRTTATRTDGGWLLNGQKVWTGRPTGASASCAPTRPRRSTSASPT
jgi:3-oxochol-4-en-24-oyl-CoA dehydrogenase